MVAVPASEASSDEVQVFLACLGQEAEAAEVHAKDGNFQACLGHAVRHAEQRAVAAQHEQHVHALRQLVTADELAVASADQAGRFQLEDGLDPALFEPALDRAQFFRRGGQPRLQDDADAMNR